MFRVAALILIGLSTFGSLLRVILGPTVWDRLLGIGLGASKVTLAVVLLAVSIPESYLLDLALLFAVLGFLVTVLLARFIERQGIV
ncbi:pH regulation protein F [Alkalispirochaeta sphaeroplastigenens]|uniref:pH regulation protein F n=1 Tax=Alkalispirochaeta sphaeroplastigenens TaxID=1187066 RepID=A0A2S4JG28_9SPIO|nr:MULTISPECIES: monovalent cation/H+ antiporter complex subunit F [Alkalispirochaeta]POQ98491.1 pH regulation protein F [Alkalispirochaeta sphaeroplastigenens]